MPKTFLKAYPRLMTLYENMYTITIYKVVPISKASRLDCFSGLLFFWQVKSACSKLRGYGVRGHLGVFGVHYEADNSRVYVVCAKHVTEAELHDEFKVFGNAEVKLNTDVNGFSKVKF